MTIHISGGGCNLKHTLCGKGYFEDNPHITVGTEEEATCPACRKRAEELRQEEEEFWAEVEAYEATNPPFNKEK